MQVIIGGNQLYGARTGIGQYTQELVNGLLQDPRVEELTVFVHGFTRPASNSREDQPGEESSATQHQSLAWLRERAARSATLVRLYDAILPMTSRWSLRRFGADAIYHAPDFILPPFKGSRIATILDLSTLKHPEFHPPARVSIVNRHIRQAAASADHILTISDFVKKEIMDELNVPADRITTTHLGPGSGFRPVSAEEFTQNPGQELGLAYKNYLLSLCTIEPRKNIPRLLDAYEAYREEAGSNALPLVIVGHPGWKSESVHQRLQALAQMQHVHYLGYLDQSTTNILVGGARALVLPSIYEGFGLPVLEAMCAGTAVITSANSAMAEVSREAAILVDPYRSEDIAQAMRVVADNSARVSELERYGLDRSADFSWESCISKTLSVYEKVGASH